MPSYSIEGVIPVVDPSAYVHPTAVLIGDVIVGPDCYVGPSACLRGDFGRIVLKAGANVQDTCVVHGFPQQDTVVEENGHIGHGAVLHSCIVPWPTWPFSSITVACAGKPCTTQVSCRLAPRRSSMRPKSPRSTAQGPT